MFLSPRGYFFWFLLCFRRCKFPDFGVLEKHSKLPILGSSLTSPSLQGFHSKALKPWSYETTIANSNMKIRAWKNIIGALCLRKKGQTFHVPFKDCLQKWSFTTVQVFISSLPSWTSLKPYLLAVVPTACGHVLLQALAPREVVFFLAKICLKKLFFVGKPVNYIGCWN